MKKTLLVILILLIYKGTNCQTPQVPTVMYFADMELRLNSRVRDDIQMDVNALTRSEKYFNIKLGRVKQYFPIIERIFREENVPDDFKFLVIQESALISNAVSTANAVGFWQFKEPSATEVGLRIDRYVDERMNIVSATRGAAKYLKMNNFYYDNWLYALLAYQAGRGGAEAYINERHFGDKKMDLNRHTHWYVKKFLAHKIAFQNVLNNGLAPEKRLFEFTDGMGMSLSEIAMELNVKPDDLNDYNKWLKRGRVPEDKVYTVIVPTTDFDERFAVRSQGIRKINYSEDIAPDHKDYPKIKSIPGVNTRLVKINGLQGIVAIRGDDKKSLSDLGGISINSFLKYNDIDISHRVIPGQVYYFQKKKNKAKEYYHTAYSGENSWTISQKYGIKEQKLLRKNRIRKDHVNFDMGRVVWLRFIRPEDNPVEYVELSYKEPESVTSETSTIMSQDQLNRDDTENNRLKKESSLTDTNDTYIETHLNENKESSEIQNSDGYSINGNFNQGRSAGGFFTDKNAQYPLFHIVEAGETLYGISKKYTIPVETMLSINDLDIDSNLQIGQKIYLKNPFPNKVNSNLNRNNEAEGSNSYIIYIVKKGETLYSISRRYNVNVDEIMNWNQKNDFSISEGEKLKIKRAD